MTPLFRFPNPLVEIIEIQLDFLPRDVYILSMISQNKTAWVNVIFPTPPYMSFTYHVPDALQDVLIPGHRVLVPLGRRKVTGFVIEFTAKPNLKTLPVQDVLDLKPVLAKDMVALTRWMADYYLAPWGEVLRSALPPGMHRQSDLIITVIGENTPSNLPPAQAAVWAVLQEKKHLSLKTLEKSLNRKNCRALLNRMAQQGLISLETVLEESRVKVAREQWLEAIRRPDDEEMAALEKRAPRQARALKTILSRGRLQRRAVDAPAPVIRRLEEAGFIASDYQERIRRAHDAMEIPEYRPVTLTDEQQAALHQVEEARQSGKFRPFLLYGVTGSGKTQVYIEAIRRALEDGQSALVLIPEISLTPQAVQRYRSAFGDNVAVMHSRMSAGERFDSWRKMKEGRYKIGLGPRSALFSPLDNLGLIVVDEEHESSYKQMDPSPRYHARDAAVMRAKINRCVIILGSATPSLESFANAREGKYTLARLTHRIDHVPMPRVTLIDHEESGKQPESRILSPEMKSKIEARLEAGEQIILMQNRRGYAPFMRCRECGAIEMCPHCDISLTYHQRDNRLKCHYCGLEKKPPDFCGECGQETLSCRGIGTQQVEERLGKLFDQARIIRMDQDTTRNKGAHDRIVTDFEKRQGDILLGTQMVAKGHDFSGVNMVGIISADTGLHFPDFRSGERTFQLLTQAAGRAGRRDIQGEVAVQTRSADHPVIGFAMHHDYPAFFEWEIKARKELRYPPFGKLILIRFRGKEESLTHQAADFFRRLSPSADFFQLLGPAPSPLAKIKGMYRYQLLFKSEKSIDANGARLRELVRRILERYHEEKRFADIRVSVDVDPMDMM